MCGRFSITDPDEALRALFGYNGPPMDFVPRYNVAPTQNVPVVRLNSEGKRAIVAMRWGLIPSWAKDAKIGSMMINARADTVATKPAFRAAFKARHCLVLANGFYEWQAAPGSKRKQPFYFRMRDGQAFVWLAGVGPAVLWLAFEKLRRTNPNWKYEPNVPLVRVNNPKSVKRAAQLSILKMWGIAV